MSFEQQATGNQYGTQNDLRVEGTLNAALAQTVLHLSDGRSIALPTEVLLSAGSSSLEEQLTDTVVQRSGNVPQTIALVSEHMEVGKRTVETGKVRLHRGTETFTDTVGLELTRVGWEVERIPVGEVVAERPEIREDGEVTIFPLVEERLVARREYFLLEEVRVRRVATTTERSATLQLKRDVLTVERSEVSPAASKGEMDSNFEIE